MSESGGAVEPLRTTEILGVPVACVDLDGLLATALAWSGGAAPPAVRRTILYGNAHSLNLACDQPLFRRILQSADLVYADGVSLVWAARVLGGCRLVKMTGADWIQPFCARAAESGTRIYILAGEPGQDDRAAIAQRAAQTLQERYPGLRIVGARHGYFSDAEVAQVLAEINRAAPQVLFVGLGSPRQEQFLGAHRAQIEAPLCWGVGALFDYVAGREARVPGWLYRLGLEWLWRLLVDPRRKWRRYLLGNPRFVLRVLGEKYRIGVQ